MRSDKYGAVNTNRLKSCHEIRAAKQPSRCKFCGVTKCRVDRNCSERKQFGRLAKLNEIDGLVHDLTTRNSPAFSNEEMNSSSRIMEQMHPDTRFLCIHSYAYRPTTLVELSQGSMREDTSYLCVTMIFKPKGNKETPSLRCYTTKLYTSCFMRTGVVAAWMTKTLTNRKSVIIGRANKCEIEDGDNKSQYC